MWKRVGKLDHWMFDRVARASLPGFERVLPGLSRTADRSLLWFGIAGVMGSSRSVRLRRAALRGTLAIAITSPLVNLLGKQAFRRKRPRIDLVPPIRVRWRIPTSPAFPSGHSASAAAFATGVAFEAPPLLRGAIATLAVGVAASRVYNGAHYPGDVAAGAAMGVAAGMATRLIWPLRTTVTHTASGPQEGAEPVSADGTGMWAVVNNAAGGVVPVTELLRPELPGATILEAGDDLAGTLDGAARERPRVLAVAGGDGTVNAAAAVAMRHDLVLLPIPGGTFDRFCREFGLVSIGDALETYRAGGVTLVDVGLAGDAPFLNTAGFGAYTDLVRERTRLERYIGKWPALAVAGARVLRRAEPIRMTIGGRTHHVWLGFVGNCRYASRGVAPTWRGRLDDGLLDVRLIAGRTRSAALLALVAGHLRVVPGYTAFRTRHLTVSGPAPLRLITDGELREIDLPMTFRKIPMGLRVCAPVRPR